MLVGRGVAYRVESPELTALRDELAEAFAGLLVPQDQGRPRFHITVQKKVEPAEAKALAAELRRAFRHRPPAIAGLAAWPSRSGPGGLSVPASMPGVPSVRPAQAALAEPES